MKLFTFAVALTVGLGVAGCAQPDLAQSQTTAGPSTPAQSSRQQNIIRQRLLATGLDPDTPQGRIVARWLPKLAAAPARRRFFNGSLDASKMWASDLSADQRREAMRRIKDIVSGTASDCRLLQSHGDDFVARVREASPRAVEDVMEFMQILADGPKSGNVYEHYSTAELLDADAAFNSTQPPDPVTHAYPTDPCALIAFGIRAIDKLPPDMRDRASLEFFRMMSRRPLAFQSVIASPATYFDQEFDERLLPEQIRSRLPADGSRPMPYSRIVVDADWVNKTTPADDAAFIDAFVNRRNNGVVAELVTSPGWVDYGLNFGVASLRAQTVGTGTSLTPLRTLPADAVIASLGASPVPGQRVEIAVPEPALKAAYPKRCEVAGVLPASAVLPHLEGIAISMNCSQYRASGRTNRLHTALFLDYGFMWTDWIDDEDGRTKAIVRKVTVYSAKDR